MRETNSTFAKWEPEKQYSGLEVIGQLDISSLNIKYTMLGEGIPELTMKWKAGARMDMGTEAAKQLDKARYGFKNKIYARCRIDFFTVTDDE